MSCLINNFISWLLWPGGVERNCWGKKMDQTKQLTYTFHKSMSKIRLQNKRNRQPIYEPAWQIHCVVSVGSWSDMVHRWNTMWTRHKAQSLGMELKCYCLWDMLIMVGDPYWFSQANSTSFGLGLISEAYLSGYLETIAQITLRVILWYWKLSTSSRIEGRGNAILH